MLIGTSRGIKAVPLTYSVTVPCAVGMWATLLERLRAQGGLVLTEAQFAATALALEQPASGQVRIANELRKCSRSPLASSALSRLSWSPARGAATRRARRRVNNGIFDVRRHAVLQHRLLAADFLQRQVIFCSVVMVSSNRRGGGCTNPTRSALRLASCFVVNHQATSCQVKVLANAYNLLVSPPTDIY
jgi:hypothetical protein